MRHDHRKVPGRCACRRARALAAALAATPGLAVAAAAGTPRPASAQVVPPVRLEVAGGLGTLQPGTDLARGSGLAGGATRLGAGLTLGGTAGLHFAGGFVLEAEALWSPDVPLEDGTGTQEGNAAWLALGLDALYRPSLPVLGSLFEPFVGAGLGVRRLSLHPKPPVAPPVTQGGGTSVVVLADSSARRDFAVEGLVGTYVDLPGLWRIRAELRDYVTSFSDSGDARLQNDLALLGSFVLRVP